MERGSGGVEVTPLAISETADLYPQLKARFEGAVLLETCTPGGGSVLAWDPAVVISVNSGAPDLRYAKGFSARWEPKTAREVPRFLEDVRKSYRVTSREGVSSTPPFIGGFIGFVGYEWAAGQEGPTKPTEPMVPNMWFGLYDRAIVSDQLSGASLVTVPTIRGTTPAEAKEQIRSVLGNTACISKAARASASGAFKYDFPRGDFELGVRTVKRAIRNGDVYQANIAQRIRAAGVDPWDLYLRLKRTNPSPYAGALSAGDFTLVSASPERLLKVSVGPKSTRLAATRPIAGTRPRARGAKDRSNERALRSSPKERAEHTMLVDLSRNDLGRVAVEGSVEVDELFTVERYSHVMHLVSNVKARLSSTVGTPELFRSLMPGGSVTGTPKIRATEIIAEVEPVPRGAYTGSLGYISLDGSMDFNILIRSAFFPGGRSEAHIYAGSGIVQDSDPAREWKESRSKAMALLEAAARRRSTGYPWEPPCRAAAWIPPRTIRRFGRARVLLIDNYDSFTYNLAQYLSTLGAKVTVIRNDEESPASLAKRRPTHVVISPGPGRPSGSGLTPGAVIEFEGTPILGVCLGLQAIVEAYGGSLTLARRPVHGKASMILRKRSGLREDILDGLPRCFVGARYHSLVAGEVPPELAITARSRAGEVMAIQHRRCPTYGVQFHPESILAEGGIKILSNFLSIRSPVRR